MASAHWKQRLLAAVRVSGDGGVARWMVTRSDEHHLRSSLSLRVGLG